MSKKFTIEDVRKFAKSKGYEVIDEEYVDIKTYMKFKCIKCGNIVEKTFDNFKYRNNCPNCSIKRSRVIYTLDVVKNFLEKHNVELVYTKWDKGVNSWMTLRCKDCGHEFERVFENFRINPSCPRCRENPRRLKYEDVKQFVEIDSGSGCKFLETKESYNKKRRIEPRMACCKFLFECSCGNEFEVDFNTFKNGNKQRCNECTYKETGNGMRFSYKDIKYYIEVESNSGCKLLSETYKGNHKPLHLKCSCGNEFYRALAEFKGRKLFKCKECTGATIQYTYEQVYNDLKEHNIKLLSKEYINNQTNMDIEYSCGFRANRNYANIKKSDYKCPHCIKQGYGRDTEQLRREIEEVTNGEYTLLSEYKTMNDKVLIRHNSCDTAYEVTPHNFLDSGNRCPICGSSKGESKVKEWLEFGFFTYDREYIFDDLKGDYDFLRFDFAIFEDKSKTNLKCLIEYDGEFHYKPIMGKEKLKIQQRYDKLKNEYCKVHNIRLIRIPYWEFDNIENILNDILINNNQNSEYIVNNNKYNIVLEKQKLIS